MGGEGEEEEEEEGEEEEEEEVGGRTQALEIGTYLLREPCVNSTESKARGAGGRGLMKQTFQRKQGVEL